MIVRHENEKVDRVLSLGHLSMAEAERRLGMTPNYISSFLGYRGLRWPTSGGLRTPAEEEARRVLMHSNGMSFKDISKVIGVSPEAVRIWFKKRGITK